MGKRKDKTGLEWLLREADKPPAPDTAIPEGTSRSSSSSGSSPESLPPAPSWTPSKAHPAEASLGGDWQVKSTGDAVNLPVVPVPRGVRNTRTQPRVRADFEVQYKKGSETVVAKGVNISLGGLFVAGTKYIAVGEVVQAEVRFPSRGPTEEARRLAVIVEVIWATEGDPENIEKYPPGMGVKFLDVDDKDRPFLKSRIDEKLTS